MSDRTVDHIYELTDRLQECLKDSADLRERLINAQDANRWPDLEGAVARVARHAKLYAHGRKKIDNPTCCQRGQS